MVKTAANGKETKALRPGEMPIHIHAQYIKDMSFESPGAPDSLRGRQAAPQMNVSFNLETHTLKGDVKNFYEVVMTVKASAMRDGRTLFIAELAYGVAVSIGEAVPEEQQHPILFIEVPRHAFPFVRQIMSTVTSQAGLPPLLLSPLDFHSLYVSRFKDHIGDAPKAGTKTVKGKKKTL